MTLAKRAPWLAALLLLAGAAIAEDPAEIEVGFLNGVYTDLDSGIAPVHRGALTLHLSSPRHRITVHGNRLRLADDGAGALDASLEVDFEGEGDIVVVLESGGLKNRIDDHVSAPRQSVTVTGKTLVERVAGGYLMTVVDAQPTVDLKIESAMAGRLVGLCKAFEKLPLIPVDCAGIETALSVVTVPLPQPGTQFLVPAERLTADEKAFFERFAGGAVKEDRSAASARTGSPRGPRSPLRRR